MAKLPAEALAAAAGVAPRDRFHAIPREADIPLSELLRAGLKVPGAVGGVKVRVRFERVDGPFPAHRGTGWYAVRVRANTGAESVLMYEAEGGGRVSGLARLRP